MKHNRPDRTSRALTRRRWIRGATRLGAWALAPVTAALGQARVGSTVAGDDKAPALPILGDPWTLVDVTLLDGRSFRAHDPSAHLTLLYWWASWCPFCAQTSPQVEGVWRRWQGRGLRVLGLSLDRSAETAREYLAKRGFSFPSAMLAQSQGLPRKPKGLPVTIALGRDGRVVFAESGELFPQDLDILEKHL